MQAKTSSQVMSYRPGGSGNGEWIRDARKGLGRRMIGL